MLTTTSRLDKQLQKFEAGVEAVLKSLNEPKAVLNAQLSRVAFFHIAQVIAKNKTLLLLDLSHFLRNKKIINDQSMLELFQFIARDILQKNKVLQELILDESIISNKVAALLASALKKSSIQKVSLAFCKFESPQGIFLLLEAIYQNPNIQNLNLFGSIDFEEQIDLEILREWQDILKRKLTIDSITAELCEHPEKYLALTFFQFSPNSERSKMGLYYGDPHQKKTIEDEKGHNERAEQKHGKKR